MRDSSPWDDIAVPSADFNVRHVTDATAVPCYWGRDTNGACLFIVELQGDHTVQYRKNLTNVHGIHVDLRYGDSNLQRLLLTLDREADRDLFHGLCRTLAVALTRASNSASSLAVALAHIHRWKTFFSGGVGLRLSADEVRGLFAELAFLLELLASQGIPRESIAAWLGPEKSHQDFIYRNTAVEIKSLSGTERGTVRVSSEDQLETLKDSLFLRTYRLSSLPGALAAKSLNEIVAAVQDRLPDSESLEEFGRKLVKQRYAPLPDYDEPTFVVADVRTYRVTAEFPKLIRSRLPGGIAKVAYDIKLESISSFQCDDDLVFEGM